MGLLDIFGNKKREFADNEARGTAGMIKESLKLLIEGGFEVTPEVRRSPNGGSYKTLTFQSKTNPKLSLKIVTSTNFYGDGTRGKVFGGVTLTTVGDQKITMEPYKLQAEAQGNSQAATADNLGRKTPDVFNLIDRQSRPDPRWREVLTELANQAFPNAYRGTAKREPLVFAADKERG